MKNHEQNRELFNKTLAILKQKIIAYHDEKVKSEIFINENYLEYLALKYTAKTMKEIHDTLDVDALETIINNLK